MSQNFVAPPTNLLVTKTYIPANLSNLVVRSRLEDRLLVGIQTKLTLVIAPAGYGKTTLLGQVLNSVIKDGRRVAWISLDEYDNAPVRFWAYVVEALGGVQPEIRAILGGMRKQACPPADCPLISGLINEFNNHQQPTILVLDDYHVISTATIHQDLQYLLQQLPRNLHIVIASRKQPQLSLSRMRANGQVVEVGCEELSFTLEEVGIFFQRVMKLSLNPEEVQQIFGLMEGWIAGLQLAGLSLQKNGDVLRFTKKFAGSHRTIWGYLHEEVLSQQDERIREFLLKTSILRHMNALLCNAVLNQTDSDEVLAALVQDNLFVTPIYGEQQWYHYHSLFQEVLQHELYLRHPEVVPELHGRAIQWYEENGYPEDAVDQALAAGDKKKTIELIESNYLIIYNNLIRGDDWLVSKLFKMIPKEEIWNNASLSMLYMWLYAQREQTEKDPFALSLIERLFNSPGFEFELNLELQEMKKGLDILRANILLLQGDYDRAKKLASQLLCATNDGNDDMRTVLQVVFGYSSERTGDISQAEQIYRETLLSADPNKRQIVVSFMHFLYSRLLHLRGKLDQAARTCKIIPGVYKDSDTIEWYRIEGALSINLGKLQLEWNQLEQAELSINRGVEFINQYVAHNGRKYWQLEADIGLALLKQAQGDIKSANEILSHSISNDPDLSFCFGIKLDYMLEQGKLAIRTGDIERASYYVSSLKRNITSDDILYSILLNTFLVKYALAMQSYDVIPELIDASLDQARDFGLVSLAIELMVLRALYLQSVGKIPSAVRQMSQALLLAQPENYVRTIICTSPDVARLLYKTQEYLYKQDGISSQREALLEYIQELLHAFKQLESATDYTQPGADALVENLTENLTIRELEILHMISTGMSQPDIARRLVISKNTLRTHFKHIYSKLDVHDQTRAIMKARELGLLSSYRY